MIEILFVAMRRLITLTLTLTLILFFPAHLFAQGTIYGIVVDSLTQEPLPMATVYVNGTTQGTATDNDGRFELGNVSFPAIVVFSYVGYQPKALDLDRNPGRMTIELTAKSELPEVVVSGKNKKIDKVNLDYFKSMFLGDDKWGKHSSIKNENVLMFDNSYQYSYYTRAASRTSFANPYASNDVFERHEEYVDTVQVVTNVFSAWAYEPLIIDMPLFGYELYVDLVKFTVEKVNNVTQCNMLGYFYYKPYEKLKKRQADNVENNRMRAYWGSSQHFLRSFAQDSLAENGYILTMPKTIVKGKKSITIQLPVNIDEYTTDVADNLMRIYGLKDKNLRIRYYRRSDGSPLNLREKRKGIHRYYESGMTVLEDYGTFRKEGIVIDNNIRFTGDISKKRVAACLPDDYIPLGDTSKIKVSDVADYASGLMKFADNINQFNSLFPQEKVYLEFDNTAYFQGENIWFKAFVTHATSLERSPSGVLYVDFLAPTGQLILQQKLKVESGQADGVISLLDAGTQQTRDKRGVVAYPSGFYEIRAYTQNMLDFSPEAIFSRVIPVYTQPKYVGEYNRSHVVSNQDNPLVEKLRGKSLEQKKQNKDVNVTFYPEGGDLISGLPCRVAFKATDSGGFGVEGVLRGRGAWDSICTVHDGMGSFIITPQGNYSYMDFYLTGSDNNWIVVMPPAKSSGYSMMADMLSDSRLQVNIWRTQDRIGEQTAIVVTCRGDVIHFEEIKDIENSQFEIDCSEWPVGVCRLTLFDKDGRILSSRSVFHNSWKYRNPTIEANTDSMSHQSCDKEVIEFKLTDQDGNPMRDRFCLSVRDAADYGNGRDENILTNLLLSSDLRGYIHDPAWYLESNDEEHREALNLLTLIQGWERYEWQTMTGLKDFNEKHRIEEGLTMNGWILTYGRRKPVPDISIYAALTPDDDKTLYESFDYQTDSTGYFGFDLSDFYGKGDFTIHVMATKKDGESKYKTGKRIRFERADRPEPRPFLRQETDLSRSKPQVDDYEIDFTDAGLTDEQRKKLGKIIGEVDIEEESAKRRFIDYDTFTSFEAEEDAELELDEGEYTTDVYGYLLERGIRIINPTEYYDPTDFEAEVGEYEFGNKRWGSEEDDAKERDSKEDDDGSSGKKSSSGKDISTGAVNDIKAYIYAHTIEDYYGNSAYQIDMIDVKSIITYDKPMYPREFADLIPIEMEFRDKHIHTAWFWWLWSDWERYTLIDVQVKEDWQRLHNWEILNLGRRTTTVKGFTRPVQFYSPEYPEGPIEGNIDARRTLYWNPNVITDEDGRARVEFYNNSFTRRFTINAAGITASGIPYILNQDW